MMLMEQVHQVCVLVVGGRHELVCEAVLHAQMMLAGLLVEEVLRPLLLHVGCCMLLLLLL